MDRVPTVAVMGASGFIGSRVVEKFHLCRTANVRPVVRSLGSLARLARFDLEWRMADACDAKALVKAFMGCDAVIHSVLGHPELIERSVAPAYRAACQAGVKRLIYLSSAAVHGQSPPPGTNESSPLSARQRHDYNNRKVHAEQLLRRERENGAVEIVILRPGIVLGPRSQWITNIASVLIRRRAFLVGGGEGLCNSTYVDNLVQAISLSLTAGGVDGEAFLIGDDGTASWKDLYGSMAAGLGIPFETISDGEAPHAVGPSLSDRLKYLRSASVTQAVLPYFPDKLKRAAKAAWAAWCAGEAPVASWAQPIQPQPIVTEETAELHQCQWSLSSEKAKRMLGYQPAVSFGEGCRRSLEWLRFAGYDVKFEANREAA